MPSNVNKIAEFARNKRGGVSKPIKIGGNIGVTLPTSGSSLGNNEIGGHRGIEVDPNSGAVSLERGINILGVGTQEQIKIDPKNATFGHQQSGCVFGICANKGFSIG